MIRLTVLATAFLLAGCAQAPATPTPASPPPVEWPTSGPWALKPGWQEYRIYRGKGKFNRAAGWIDVDMDSLVPGEVNRNTNLKFMSQGGPAIARRYSPQGVVVTEVPEKLDGCLLERFDSTRKYIGEAGSYAGPDCTEPEPMVTLNPVPGEKFTVTSTATRWDGIKFQHTAEYRTVAIGRDIDGFTNCILTSTLESPGVPNGETIYCQAFDGEMALQIYGRVMDEDVVPELVYAKRVATGT